MARIEQAIEVNVPAGAAYAQLARFEQYPRFIEEIAQVRQLDDTHLHWRIRGDDAGMEWDAEITQQVPERSIAWRNTNGPHYAGKVELQPLADDRTRIALTLECEPGQQWLAQHGNAESALSQRAAQGLAHFKKFIEGQYAARGGQPQPAERTGQTAQAAQRTEQGGERPSWMPNLLQAWDEPLHLMRRMTEEMDQLVGRFIGRAPSSFYGKAIEAAPPAAWTPAVEVAQGADRLVICAELPGVRREDVRVEVKNDRVTIEGDRHPPQPPQQPQELRRSERSYGHFYRVIPLPEGAEPDAASAALHNGVLEITVPVPEGGRRARRLDIRAP